MVVNEVPIVAADAGFAWQNVDEKYVFFLHRLAGKGYYRIYAGGSFRLTSNATVTSDTLNKSRTFHSLNYQANFILEITDAYNKSKVGDESTAPRGTDVRLCCPVMSQPCAGTRQGANIIVFNADSYKR